MKRNLQVLALCAFFVPAAILAGCGDSGIPGNAVAEVDGTPIEKADYEHWLNVAAKSSGQPGAAVPKPPDYTECIAQAKKSAPKPAKGQPKQTDADFKKQCQQQYDQLRNQVLGLLISFEWIEREAEEQGVKVTDAEVNKSFEEQKKQSFPKDADYQKFLKDSGQTNEDVLMRVRLDALSNKIRDKVTKGKDKVTDQQIKEYYDKNKQGSRSSRSPSSTRSTTPPSPRAASCRPSPRASRRRRSTPRSSAPTRARSSVRSRRSSATTSSRSTRSTPRRSRRSSRRRRRSSRCWPRRTSRRRSTRSSRTSARSGSRRRTAARAT
jgi:SurA N-terminal domain